MLFFTAAATAVSLTRHHEQQKETQRGETELEIMEFSIFDCYLGATVSNYCLEPLKKLITGSDRRPASKTDRWTAGRPDLLPGTTQSSPLAAALGSSASVTWSC